MRTETIVPTTDACSGAEAKLIERWSGGICICCGYNYSNLLVSQLPIKERSIEMITTVSLNPAIDKTILLSDFKHGGVNRITSVREDIGGKGIKMLQRS